MSFNSLLSSYSHFSDFPQILARLKIFEVMNEEVKRDRHKFVLVILPTHRGLQLLQSDSTYHNNWYKMVSSTCALELICIDLSQDLQKLPAGQLDRGYDGTHYGPKANQLIAELIRKRLELEGVLPR